MTMRAKSLPPRRSATYRYAMAREATQMEIGELEVIEASEAAIRIDRDTAVPASFTVKATLGRPPLVVNFKVSVPAGGTAQIRSLMLDLPPGEVAITSGMLRTVALDRLLRDALKAARRPLSQGPDILPNAYHVEGMSPGEFMVGAPSKSRVEQRADEAAANAAVIYLGALQQGSRAPAEAVMAAMDRSRGQVARYIRRARELGFLPPVGVAVEDWTPAPTSSAVWRVKVVRQEDDENEGAQLSFADPAKEAERRRRFHEGMSGVPVEQAGEDFDALYDEDPPNLAGTHDKRADELARHNESRIDQDPSRREEGDGGEGADPEDRP